MVSLFGQSGKVSPVTPYNVIFVSKYTEKDNAYGNGKVDLNETVSLLTIDSKTPTRKKGGVGSKV